MELAIVCAANRGSFFLEKTLHDYEIKLPVLPVKQLSEGAHEAIMVIGDRMPFYCNGLMQDGYRLDTVEIAGPRRPA